MITTKSPTGLAAELESAKQSFASMSSQELLGEFSGLSEKIARHFVGMAAIVGILDERGEDLSSLHAGLIGYLRKIASGQLLPELFVKLHGNPLVLRKAATLPIVEQRKLAANSPVRVVIVEHGLHEVRHFDPAKISREEVHQVFADDHIRSTEEQSAWLKKREPNVRHAPVVEGVVVDPRKHGIRVTGRDVFIPVKDLRKYLRTLDGEPKAATDDARREVSGGR